MPGCRLIPGAVTARSARLRLIWPFATPTAPPIVVDPPGAVTIATAPAPSASGQDVNPGFIVDLSALEPDTFYRISVIESSSIDPTFAYIRTPPETLAPGTNVLLALTSCHFPSNQAKGNPACIEKCLAQRAFEHGLARAASSSSSTGVPTLSFRAGDQIYADAPMGLIGDLEGIYRGRYAYAWSEQSWAPAFRLGANLFTGDDHEFWNSFPDAMVWEPRTWFGGWKTAARVANRYFWSHQGVWNFPPGSPPPGNSRGWCSGTLAGLPYFVTDGRSGRTSRNGHRWPSNLATSDGDAPPQGGKQLLAPDQFAALLGWIGGLKQVGFLVLGQPLLQQHGAADNALSDYPPQWAALMNAIAAKILDAGITLVILTGDIHWGRLYSWTPPGQRHGRLVEFTSSAVGRINTPFSIFTRRAHAGKKTNLEKWVEREEANHAKVLQPFVGTWVRQRHFATNEHNFGLIDVTSTASGSLALQFELWNLQSLGIARNGWGGGDGSGLCRLQITT